MRKSVTQEFDYGCAIACIAFVLDIPYKDIAKMVGKGQEFSQRFWLKDVASFLNNNGFCVQHRYVKPHIKPLIYKDFSIVLIGRSKIYPTGHYLVRYKGTWMDPWINLPKNSDILRAKSGFRKRLPGTAKYVIFSL